MSVAASLDRALKAAGIPIVGVSIGDVDDRETWRVDFAKSATKKQKADGCELVETFDPTAKDVVDAETDAAATRQADASSGWLLFSLRESLGHDPTPTELKAGRTRLVQAIKDASA